MTMVLTIASMCKMTYAQSNCNLINSVTLNAPSITQTQQGFVLACVNNNNPPNNAGTSVNISLPMNQWSYVALTKAASNECRLFLNGEVIYAGNYASIPYSWYKLVLGAQLSGGVYSNYFDGLIDEVRVSNSVRSVAEVSSYFESNMPFELDANTIGLWHFDETSGGTVSGAIGGNGSTNAEWTTGIFGNCLSYNGNTSHTDFNFTTPTSNSTIEFWIRPNNVELSWPLMTYGFNSAGVLLDSFTSDIVYTWSTGATGNSLTLDPTNLSYIWVTDGNCTDTVWFNSETVEVFDTTFITVTDTLIINLNPTGFNPVTYANTILMYPNPTSDELTINYGDFASLAGYALKIFNSIGQEIHSANINQQQEVLQLGTWGGAGTYQVVIYNAQGVPVDTRAIVLQ